MNTRFYPEITDAVNALIDGLQTTLGSEFRIIDEFTDRLSATPLTRPTATVGIGSLESENRWFGDYLGTKNNIRQYGKLVTVTYLVTIHTPITYGGDACRTFLCKLRDAVYNEQYVHATSIRSDEIRYDRTRRCLYMPLELKMKYIV